ncbi:MAG: tRNA pseudouridine(38-40) synthase TruA [Gammaproteobacteria bacterium]|nr:tRNA pseudouridine(38-40) synthase TruA [Gammaproteobacteria bacterium]
MVARIVLGMSYEGSGLQGWQSQTSGKTVQDILENSLLQFSQQPLRTVCAGRTDAGVHALMQVVHFDTELNRPSIGWVRGVNRFLPKNMAIQWAYTQTSDFHARSSAMTRRYIYIVSTSAVRPSLDDHRVAWCPKPLDLDAMCKARDFLLGEHDFSSFRAADCQAISPVKKLYRLQILPYGQYYHFVFEANSFLQQMVRNIMGCLLYIGQHMRPVEWVLDVLYARNRRVAAPTMPACGLYFLGPTYPEKWNLPSHCPLFDTLPSARCYL